MKQLVLIRHAQAETPNEHLPDHHRRLSHEGIDDARRIGTLLSSQVHEVDCMVTSDAVRAVQTAQLIAECYLTIPIVNVDPRLYLPSLEELLPVVWSLDPQWKTVMFVGHNPSISKLVEFLSGTLFPPLQPSTGVVLRAMVEHWTVMRRGSCRLAYFIYPGQVLSQIETR